MILAEEYFGDYEVSVRSFADFRNRLLQVRELAKKTDLQFFWRGQADAAWGVHSSLHCALATRLGRTLEDVEDTDVVSAEERIVSEARDWIRPSVGARLTTVDLFARLQHHNIPTRLVDFSTDPNVALYFACSEKSEKDGRLIVGAARFGLSSTFRNDFAIPWRRGSEGKPDRWVSSLFALDDHADFLRIVRQSGVFLVGGTPSTQPHRRLKSSGYSLKATDVRRAMSLPLALHSWAQAEAAESGKRVRGRDPTIATALTLRVPSRLKSKFVQELDSLGYRASWLFPDVQGLAAYGSMSARPRI